MLFYTNKVVLKSKEQGLKYSNVCYFIKRYESDCCVCLQFPKDSILTECNHVFCKACLQEIQMFFNKCPICAIKFTTAYKVKLILLKEIKDHIVFRKVPTCQVQNYFDFPYLFVYYENDIVSTTNRLVYQSNDGQPYFLCSDLVTKIGQKQHQPEFIFGEIKKIMPLTITKSNKKQYQKYCTLYNYHDLSTGSKDTIDKNKFNIKNKNVVNGSIKNRNGVIQDNINTKSPTINQEYNFFEGSVIYIVTLAKGD